MLQQCGYSIHQQYYPSHEDEIGDEIVLVFLVFVVDEVHHRHDHKYATQEFEQVQHLLGDAPFVLLGAMLVDGKEYCRDIAHYG